MLEHAGDPVALCAALVDVPSVSGEEAGLADLVETAFRQQAPHLEVLRSGEAVLARTQLGRERRVLLSESGAGWMRCRRGAPVGRAPFTSEVRTAS